MDEKSDVEPTALAHHLKDDVIQFAESDELTVHIDDGPKPTGPGSITFLPTGIYIGSDHLCMEGEFGIDFKKMNTLTFTIKGEKFTYKKV